MNNEGGLTREMQMTQDVQQALQADDATGKFPIDVGIQGASAALHGEVDTQETKDRATQITRGIDGIVDVINELTVRGDRGDRGGLFGLGRSDDSGASDTSAGDVRAAAVPLPTGTTAGGASGAGLGAVGIVPLAGGDVGDDTTTSDQ